MQPVLPGSDMTDDATASIQAVARPEDSSAARPSHLTSFATASGSTPSCTAVVSWTCSLTLPDSVSLSLLWYCFSPSLFNWLLKPSLSAPLLRSIVVTRPDNDSVGSFLLWLALGCSTEFHMHITVDVDVSVSDGAHVASSELPPGLCAFAPC